MRSLRKVAASIASRASNNLGAAQPFAGYPTPMLSIPPAGTVLRRRE
jgi:hypothetical protein